MTKVNLTHKGYTGSFEVSFEDDCLHGRVLFIDDLISYEGATPAELKQEFVAAVDRYIDHCAKTEKAPNKPYSGTYNVRVGQELHRKAAQCAQRQGITLNELNVRALQAVVEHNGVAKVEHVHKHEVTIADQKIMDPVFATTGIDSPWETFNASAH